MKRIIINVLIIILLGVMAFSGYRLYSIHSKYQKARSEYDRASNQYVKEKTGEKTCSVTSISRRIWKGPDNSDLDAVIHQYIAVGTVTNLT